MSLNEDDIDLTNDSQPNNRERFETEYQIAKESGEQDRSIKRRKLRNIQVIFAAISLSLGFIFLFLRGAFVRMFYAQLLDKFSTSYEQDSYIDTKTGPFILISVVFFITSIILLLYIYLEFYNAHSLNVRNINYKEDTEITSGSYNSSYFHYSGAVDIGSLLFLLDKDFDYTKLRITSEIKRLSKSANLNLAFGSVTTFAALSFLGYEVFTQTINFKEPLTMIAYYVPRISIAIFVEIFAFFFLKVYRTNLSDIKYFHNELTNIEIKIMSIRIAITNKEDIQIQSVIGSLISTERNFVLKKDESTIELEKEKIEFNNSKNIIDALKEVIKIKA